MSKKVIKNVQEVVNIIGLHNPILIGGYALEYYGLRKGGDYDFIIKRTDFRKLQSIYGESDDKGNVWLDLRGKHGGVDNFVRIYQYDHMRLKKNAIQEKNFLVASPEDLYMIKQLNYLDKSYYGNKNKNLKDMARILKYIENNNKGWDKEFSGRKKDDEIDFEQRIVKY